MRHQAMYAAACLLLALFPISPTATTGQDQDVVATAAGNGNFKTLVNLLVATGLDRDLRQPGHFTVFAPTDEAFDKLPQEQLEALSQPENREQLVGLLKYHVVGEPVSIADRKPRNPLKRIESLNGKVLQFERADGGVRVNDANVIQRNIACSNGLIQVIDQVLIPPQRRTLADVAAGAEKFQTLLTAAQLTGLDAALRGEDPLTILAPTDEAFGKLGSRLDELVKEENREQLAAILKAHILPGRVSAKQAVELQSAKTINDADVEFTIQGGRLKVNQTNVLQNDLEAENGIIHVIDAVLQVSDSDSKSHDSEADISQQSAEITDRIVIKAGWSENIVRDGVRAEVVEVRASGGGTVTLTNLEAGRLVTSVGGASRISANGVAERHEAKVSGGGRLAARKLTTGTTKVSVSGGGSADVNATRLLDVTASAGASVRYVDNGGQIKRSVNSYASLVPLPADVVHH